MTEIIQKGLDARLKSVMDHLLQTDPHTFKTQAKVAKHIGYPQTNLSAALKGNQKYLTETIVNKFLDKFPEINKVWLKTGKGEMISPSTTQQKLTALSKIDIDGNNSTYSDPSYKREVVPIDNADYMMVEYADLSVQAGPLGRSPVEDLPKNRTMLVPKEYDNGEYMVLKVDGNSMYKKGSDISIPDGTKILVKKFYLNNGDTLPIRNNLFVIDAKDGQALKQIILHDVENGFIRCRSYNEDFKDYDVKMEDIYQLFIYRKVVSSRPPIPDIETN